MGRPTIPNALVLINPDAVHVLHTRNAEYMAAHKRGDPVPDPATLPALDLSEAFVYRARDFAEIISEIDEARSLTTTFALMLILEENPNGALFQQLSASPQIRTELDKAKKPI